MNTRPVSICGLVAGVLLHAAAQSPSHVSVSRVPKPAGNPVARVNGAVLTDRDLLREMYTIFPYARQHSGFPKAMEGQIRNGAMQMIIFEELLYQQALARKTNVSEARLNRAVADFRKQFTAPTDYSAFMKEEFNGSEELLRAKVRRSLLIEDMLRIEVTSKAAVSAADTRNYYNQHREEFRTPESYAVQTISIIPPENATASQLKEARKRADEALRLAKATKSYEEFGMLAEKMSEDNYRVMMGDHKSTDKAKLPPEIVQTLPAMKTGEVSSLIQLGQAYCIVRLNGHTEAGMKKFEDVQENLRRQLETRKTDQLRSDLRKRLRAAAKVEEL
ncbi:MAG: peptidyl-prolyl cis-trans isomerase [Bryobacteraceae bacterium]